MSSGPKVQGCLNATTIFTFINNMTVTEVYAKWTYLSTVIGENVVYIIYWDNVSRHIGSFTNIFAQQRKICNEFTIRLGPE